MLSRFLLTAGVAVALAAPAVAQASFDTSARPTAGTLSPRADRAPEMLDFTLRGASETGREDCYGYFEPSAPDAVVDWPGSGTLRITVRSSTDATLAVVDPQGMWHCNDDGDGLAPVVELPDAPRGRYVVWAGSFAEGGGGAATLVAGRPAVPTAPDPSATPQERIEVTGGFSADGAVERSVAGGGPDGVLNMPIQVDAPFGCNGFVDAAQPSARIRYTPGGDGRLTVRATTADADAVLLVHLPDGTWRCDDDSGEGLNSALAIDDATAGDYAVWVGTFSSLARTETVDAILGVSEDEVVDADMDFGMDFEPTPYSAGTYRPLDLTAAPPTRLALRTDEAVSAEVSVRPDGFNPVSGDACRGRIESGPTVGVTLAGDGPVGLTASGEGDLVMVVLTPGGEWFCSDDADGLDPGVQIDTPESGTYRVWVGSFSEVSMEESPSVMATVTVARGELVVSGGDFGMEGGLGSGDAYAEGTYDGPDLVPGSGATTLSMPGTATVQAGGPLENPVVGPVCSGFVTPRPTASVMLDGSGTLRAMSDADDLVMVVHTPGGRWLCSDDADGSSDPMVRIDDDMAGSYTIWVGTFSRRDETVEARLAAER